MYNVTASYKAQTSENSYVQVLEHTFCQMFSRNFSNSILVFNGFIRETFKIAVLQISMANIDVRL